MINEKLSVAGELQIVLRDKNGNVKVNKTEKNLVVSTGKAFIAKRMVGTASVIMSHMAVGSTNTAPIAGHTALMNEIGRAAIVSSDVVDNTVTYSCLFAAGVGTGALTEAGIFNSDTNGEMLSRVVFSEVNKDIEDTLTINWQITLN